MLGGERSPVGQVTGPAVLDANGGWYLIFGLFGQATKAGPFRDEQSAAEWRDAHLIESEAGAQA